MEEVQRHSLVKPGMRKNSLNLFQFTWIIDRLPLVAKGRIPFRHTHHWKSVEERALSFELKDFLVTSCVILEKSFDLSKLLFLQL